MVGVIYVVSQRKLVLRVLRSMKRKKTISEFFWATRYLHDLYPALPAIHSDGIRWKK